MNGPKYPTLMVLNKQYLVTRISTYHWNKGQGDLDESQVPRSISINDQKGNRYGPWIPLAQNPDRTDPKYYWMVRPNMVLPPGKYRILDSHWSTWSHNGNSAHRGMARVWGVPCE